MPRGLGLLVAASLAVAPAAVSQTQQDSVPTVGDSAQRWFPFALGRETHEELPFTFLFPGGSYVHEFMHRDSTSEVPYMVLQYGCIEGKRDGLTIVFDPKHYGAYALRDGVITARADPEGMVPPLPPACFAKAREPEHWT